MNGLPPPDWQGSASDYLGQSAPQPVAPSQQFQPPQPPMGPTLGQVSQTANGGGDLMAQFQQALQLTQRAYAPAIRELKQPQQHGLGWWLGNAASFGMVGAMEHDYNAGYNRQVERDNQVIRAKAAQDAMDLVQKQAGIQDMGLKQQLAIANLQARIAQLAISGKQLELAEQTRKLAEATGTSVPMPTAEQADVAGKVYGQEWVPDPTLGGGRGHYVQRKPAYNAPDPRTPLGQALGGGTSTGGTMSPGEYKQSVLDTKAAEKRKFEEQKTVLPTTTTRSMAEIAPKVLSLADQVEKQLDKLNINPLSARWREFKSGHLGVSDPDFTAYRTTAGLLTTALLRMHVGARGGDRMMEHFRKLMDWGIQSDENMRSALQQVRDYASSIKQPSGTKLPTETETTTPTTSTTSTTIPGLNLPPGFKVLRRIQ